MLCRRDITQPPRRFEPANAPTGAKTNCVRCDAEVFNTTLYSSLIGAAETSTQVPWHYSCTASDVYKSMLEGCRWCSIIGNAVLTTVDLDFWMDDWNGSQSSTDNEVEEMDDSDESPISRNSEMTDDNETGSSGKPGFITFRALDCSAGLSVRVEFIRWGESSVFNFVDVTVSLSHTSMEDSTLPAKENDEAIRIKLEVISPGIIMMPSLFLPHLLNMV